MVLTIHFSILSFQDHLSMFLLEITDSIVSIDLTVSTGSIVLTEVLDMVDSIDLVLQTTFIIMDLAATIAILMHTVHLHTGAEVQFQLTM